MRNVLKKIKNKDGVAALVTVLLLGGFIVEIAFVGGTLVYLLTGTNLGVRLSAEALAAAQAGVDDAVLRVIRGDYSVSYSLPATGSASAGVEIGYGDSFCASGAAAQDVVATSTGAAFSKQRQLVAHMSVECATRVVNISSVTEISV